MTVSAIRLLKNGRYGLFEGETFLLSLDGDTLVQSGVRAGDELGEAELESLRALAEEQKARDKAYTLLTYRDHSREELRRKLERTAAPEAAEAAAERMEELGLINDAAYANKLARELLTGRGYGRRRAAFELSRRGIDRELAEQALDEFDDDPAQRALRFLQKKYPRGLGDEASQRRAAGALARNGYGWEDIRRAMSLYGMEQQDAD